MRQKKRQLWQLLVLALLGIATVFSLTMPEQLLLGSEPKRVEISILSRRTDSTFWSVSRQGMEQAAEDLGAELRFLTLTTLNDSAEQIELLRREAEMNVDGAVVVPADCKALEDCLANWNLFPVVTIESPVKGAAACIHPDNEQAGQQLALQLIKDLPQGGRVLLVSSCASCTGVHQRQEAAQAVLEQAGFEVQVCTELEELELECFSAVLCLDSQALLETMDKRSQQEQEPAVYGVGSTNAAVAQLETGEISALAAWSEYGQGYLAVTQAVHAARKKSVQSHVLPVTVVQEGETYDQEYQKLLYPVYR